MSISFLNFLIVLGALIVAIFSIGGEIADKTKFLIFGKMKFRLFMIIIGFLITGWASIKKDTQTSIDEEETSDRLQSYYSRKLDSLVLIKTDSIINKDMGKLFNNLQTLLGKDSARQLINNIFKVNPPTLGFYGSNEITLLPSSPLRPELEFHILALGSSAYNINIRQYYLAQTKGIYNFVGNKEGMYRIPRGTSLSAGTSLIYSDTIFTQEPRDKFYILFKGTFDDALKNRFEFQSLLEYDMIGKKSGIVFSPLQEEILKEFRKYGVDIK